MGLALLARLIERNKQKTTSGAGVAPPDKRNRPRAPLRLQSVKANPTRDVPWIGSRRESYATLETATEPTLATAIHPKATNTNVETVPPFFFIVSLRYTYVSLRYSYVEYLSSRRRHAAGHSTRSRSKRGNALSQ